MRRGTHHGPLATAVISILAAGCGGSPPPLPLHPSEVDAGLARATAFLLAAQSDDGAWRSETYGAYRDGITLTPPILKYLTYLPSADAEIDAARLRGIGFLERWTRGNLIGQETAPLPQPVYTAALAAIVLRGGSRDGEAWLDLLRRYRSSAALGWEPDDPEFGGWGYSTLPPRKPPGNEHPFEANLSATLFAVGTLRVCGVPVDTPEIAEAREFVERCQNFGRDDPTFDDGGFFFTPSEFPRNKAGVAGTDRHGRTRFASYGSATCDGIRILLRCGAAPEDPRVAAAIDWLARRFTVETNPGDFPPDREVIRDATYFYYGWSLAHMMRATGVRTFDTPRGRVDGVAALARTLLARQDPDGAWRNRFTDGKEDDPLVATPLAAGALGLCRLMMEGD